MNKPSSELIALADDHATREEVLALAINNELCRQIDASEKMDSLRVTSKIVALPIMQGLLAANQPGSERAGSMAGWTDNKLAAWARNWHWQDTADDKPVDPSIYFRDMRMLKAFVTALATPPAQPALEGGDNGAYGHAFIFGRGFYGVDIGTLGNDPAVFIIPNEKPGPVGELVPIEKQGPLERDSMPANWTALLFPTRERCKEVADALVGSKMEKWTNG